MVSLISLNREWLKKTCVKSSGKSKPLGPLLVFREIVCDLVSSQTHFWNFFPQIFFEPFLYSECPLQCPDLVRKEPPFGPQGQHCDANITDHFDLILTSIKPWSVRPKKIIRKNTPEIWRKKIVWGRIGKIQKNTWNSEKYSKNQE